MAESATLTPSKNGVKKSPEKKPIVATPPKPSVKSPVHTLQEKIEHFEKLKGFTNNHERLSETLMDLNKFVYNQGHSVSFHLIDAHGKDFKTSNTELVKIIVTALKQTLEIRKSEVETKIMKFEF